MVCAVPRNYPYTLPIALLTILTFIGSFSGWGKPLDVMNYVMNCNMNLVRIAQNLISRMPYRVRRADL